MIKSEYKVSFESLSWEVPADGVRFKSYEQDGRKLRLVEFTREFVEPNWCARGHIGYIIEGRMELNFDGEVIVFGPGDGVFIPAGPEHKHKGRALTDKVTTILIEDGE